MPEIRKVCMVAGGITKFAKARPDKTIYGLASEALDYAFKDENARIRREDIDGGVGGYISDTFGWGQATATTIVWDRLGFNPKPNIRVEGGGATGGLALRTAYAQIASGLLDVALVYCVEKHSELTTAKTNEVMAAAADLDFDTPIGGFYSAFYALMAQRHMYEFGTTLEQMAKVSVKNYGNAYHNRFAQTHQQLTVDEVLKAPLVADPLTRPMCCLMSDGAAVAILATEEKAKQMTRKPVYITGLGCGSDAMRTGDRPFGDVILLPHEDPSWYKGIKWPGAYAFRSGREAARQAYAMAGIKNPLKDIDVAELYDAYAPAELQMYEDCGFARYGRGGDFIDQGGPFLGGELPCCPSGGLMACGHPASATALMSTVFAFWQAQGTMGLHTGSDRLQVPNARRSLAYGHGGTAFSVTISILERGF